MVAVYDAVKKRERERAIDQNDRYERGSSIQKMGFSIQQKINRRKEINK
jgi:hypothetical protein